MYVLELLTAHWLLTAQWQIFLVMLESVVSLPFCMQPSDIAMVKAMKNPPAGVKLVMESVCVMKGIQPERVNDPAGTGRKVLLANMIECVSHLILCQVEQS